MNEQNGVLEYLVYLVGFLATSLLTLWNSVMTGRISRVEKKAAENRVLVHQMEVDIRERFAEHDRRVREREEVRRVEIKKDFQRLEEKVVLGHDEILKEIKRK